jgi:hypothetical protein
LNDIDVGRTPQFEAPTLADLTRKIYERPLWQTKEAVPFPVDPETWQRANTEMREVMKRQGRPVYAADWAPRPNFLLQGIPVVMND